MSRPRLSAADYHALARAAHRCAVEARLRDDDDGYTAAIAEMRDADNEATIARVLEDELRVRAHGRAIIFGCAEALASAPTMQGEPN